VRKLVDEALASVPGGSTNVQLISQEKNPLMPLGRLSQLGPLAQLRLFWDSADRVSAAQNDSKSSAFFELTHYSNYYIYEY
jgi:hypothetical protein